MDNIKNYSFYLILGWVLVIFSNFIESDYLTNFLRENIVILLIALFAINTTTYSVIMTKLKEIQDASKEKDFSNTIAQLKVSVVEQVAYILIAVFVLMLDGSSKFTNISTELHFYTAILINAVFIASLDNLRDTSSSIFVVLDFENSN